MLMILQTIWNNAILLKTATTGVLLLLLQIPACQIRTRVNEKKPEDGKLKKEVHPDFTGRETGSGPVLLVPFLLAESDSSSCSKTEKPFTYTACYGEIATEKQKLFK